MPPQPFTTCVGGAPSPMDDGIDPALVPLLVPHRHTRDDVIAALRPSRRWTTPT